VATVLYLDLVAYALLATFTPLGFAATVAVIESGRLQALAFALGFVAAQLATCAVLVAVGSTAAVKSDRDHPTFRAVLELCVGIFLLAVAAVVRRRPERFAGSAGGAGQASIDRLRRLHAATALAAGLALGVGGPKRLVLTALAASSIAASGAGTSGSAALVVGYTVVATFLVWGPILVFELVGEGVLTRLAAVQRWLRRHQRAALFYPVVTVGVLATADALVTLF